MNVPPIQSPAQAAKNQFKYMITLILVGMFASFILAFPVKWLWNWLFPTVLGLPEISAFQAWGLLFLLRLLFPQTTWKTETRPNQPDSSNTSINKYRQSK